MKPYWQHFTRKYVSIVIFITLFFLTTNILIGIAFKSRLKSRLRLVYVEEISLKEKPYKGEQTEIYIIGSKLVLWAFYSHKIDIDDNEREVKIKLWVIIKNMIRYNLGYTPPAYLFLPYNYSINIIFPFSGVWAIECNNKNISVIVYS